MGVIVAGADHEAGAGELPPKARPIRWSPEEEASRCGKLEGG